MNQSVADSIAQRYSCRAYLDEPISEEHRRLMMNFLESNRVGPLGTRARFELIAAEEGDQKSLKGLGTYGFIKNPAGFIVGALEQEPNYLEDYGYLMEHAVLFATDLGLGTCWLGGSFTKSSFAKRISATGSETVPAVVSIGYGAAGNNIRNRVRIQAGAQRRLPGEQLFFDKTFTVPLDRKETNAYTQVLDLVRRAPSASNKQPWRIIRCGNAWHFYLHRTKDYGKGTLLFKLLRLADLQRVDMGTAMCHFELSALELGLRGSWIIDEPKLIRSEGTEYTVSWISSTHEQMKKE
jgi:nitroreductase